MVTRKPLPENAVLDPAAVTPQARNVESPPPTHAGAEAIWGRGDMSGGSAGYGAGASGGHEAGLGQATETGRDDAAPVPAALRPGNGTPKQETNPFKRKMSLGASGASSQMDLARQVAAQNAPPVPSVPVGAFEQLSINETSNNPWQPALDLQRDVTGSSSVPRISEPGSGGENVWASANPSRQATPGPPSASPALVSLPSEDGSAGWGEEARRPAAVPPLITTADDDEALNGSHAWDDLGSPDKGKGPAEAPAVPAQGSTAPADDWNLIDVDPRPAPLSRQSTWENFKDEDDDDASQSAPAAQPGQPEQPEQPQKPIQQQQPKPEAAETDTDTRPELPPRNSAEVPPPPPPRPVDKSETYQIKNINWHDATASQNPRTSPILVQNANGPCPLVALVNALTLTTPADKSNTALVETLRSREQVSLGLLLDAVFDELISERRTQPDVPLPDMTELYDFLKGLHTGMNVNPRFIPTDEVIAAFKRTSLTHLNPTDRPDMIPGTFEHTREMALYSTFSIPLIHGWIPSKGDAVYDAFARQAASYEDAQNLLFREEELEEKLSSSHHEGLSTEEQQIYQDILTIKSFLSVSATQLTSFGLDVIRKSMKPGSVAILFRNDHFSTLYRHPQTLELFTLVTDAGYAGHAEVVWESLVDVNGESAEFFSGDFRLVGGASHDQPGPSRGRVPGSWADVAASGADNDGWTTVQGRRGRNQAARPGSGGPADHEQEDRDLALALQLQEEENERHRAEQERRRRESLLSEQYIEQQARGARGPARNSSASLTSPPRTSSAAATTTGRRTSAPHSSSPSSSPSQNRPSSRPATQTVRSLLPPRTATTTTTAATPATATARARHEDDDSPPPSYEQAAKQMPYVPPAGHPSHPASSPSASRTSLGATGGYRHPQQQQQQQQHYQHHHHHQQQQQHGMRRGVPPAGVHSGSGREREREKERDCTVM